MTTNKSEFRYDINALRAIAVLGVVLFHFNFPFCKGGFSGVDIFFVISGYLMSKIIFHGLDSTTFSYPLFLLKRIKRIAPALLIIGSIVVVVSFFIYFPDEFKLQCKNVLSSFLFYSNVRYVKNSEYFDPYSSTNLFLHSWSLSVEFQFYVLYPLSLIVLHRLVRNKKTLLLIFLITVVLLYAFASWRYQINKVATFYLLPMRAWELLFGGVAFLAEGLIKSELTKKIGAICAYAMLVLGFVFLNSSLPWPGLYTWIPVLSTSVIILANKSNFQIIRYPVFQFLGKISYSIYLWHWPVYVLSQYMGIELSNMVSILLVLISTGLATITYYQVENRTYSNSQLAYFIGISTAYVFLMTIVPLNKFIYKARALEYAAFITPEVERKKQFDEGRCYIVPSGNTNYNKDVCLYVEKGKRNFLLIGDSHAAELSESLHELLLAKHINLMQSTASGCLPLLNSHGETLCTDIINYIYKDFLLKNHQHIDGIILSANWLKGYTDPEALLNNLNKSVSLFKFYKIKFIIVGQSECYKIPLHIILAKEIEYNASLKENFLIKDAETLNYLLKLNFPDNYIDIYNYNKFPSLTINKTPYMLDADHFSKYGADLAAVKIISNSLTLKLLNL